jgi:single-stranded-DNA-specific exonuclease
MKWIEPENISVPAELTAVVGGHPLITRAVAQRAFFHHPGEIHSLTKSDIADDVQKAHAFLDPNLYQPRSFNDLPGMGIAIERLVCAIRDREKILIWGDFDVDGQTSTALLVSVLQSVGANVDYYIPDRIKESHGINLTKLTQLMANDYQVLLTCDTGVSALEPVEFANQNKLDVIITDHHDIPSQLPDALAVVNPRLLPGDHPMSYLPGVGVAYELAVGLLQRFSRDQEKVAYLDLVALGIIADLAILKGDVRYLLQLGMKVLRSSLRPGLLAMMERIELNPASITEDHVGFLIAPRLNALGRLADANLGVEILTTQDISKARIMALQLEALNTRRRFLTSSVFQGALSQIHANPEILEQPIIVLDNPSWPSGVIGIVASRLVERYAKPVMLITAGEDGIGRGSARSVDGVNVTKLLTQVSDLLCAYGGHPMAAGFSLPLTNITEFRKAMIRQVQPIDRPESCLQIDGYVPLASLDLSLVLDIERLAPFGPGNPPLTLVSQKLRMKSHAFLGREEEHLSIRVFEDATGVSQRVVWWQGAGWSLPDGLFDLAYHIRSQIVRGEMEIMVEWVDFRQVDLEPSTIQLLGWKPKIIDYRSEPHPMAMLNLLLSQGDAQVWAEGEAVKKLVTSGISSMMRGELDPGENIIIWTLPPGPIVFQSVVKSCLPKRIYLFGERPESDNPQGFIIRLSGLIKYVIKNKQGMVNLNQLAASTAQRVGSVQKGLDWLVAQGSISVRYEDDHDVLISIADGKKVENDLKRIWDQLVDTLTETIAFRNYFLKTDIQNISSMIFENNSPRK